MDTPRESSTSFRTAFALFAATVMVAPAGWLVMSASKTVASEKPSMSVSKVERGLTMKEWLLIAK